MPPCISGLVSTNNPGLVRMSVPGDGTSIRVPGGALRITESRPASLQRRKNSMGSNREFIIVYRCGWS